MNFNVKNRKLIIGSMATFLLLLFVIFDTAISPKIITGIPVRIDNMEGYQADSLLIQDREVSSGFIWASSGYVAYLSKDNGKTFERKFRAPVPMMSVSFFGNSKTLRKLLGLSDLMEIKVLRSGSLLTFAGGYIYHSSDKGKTFQKVHKLRFFGRGVGRGVMAQGITEDMNGDVYYGEYAGNTNRDKMYIYKGSNDGKRWSVFYEFPANSIRHIHAVQYDRYTDQLWYATGDGDKEAAIGYFDKDENLNIVCSGSQAFRAVSMIFSKDYVYWGMDSPSVQNYIYRYNKKSQDVEKLQAINGPAYFSTKLDSECMFIGTTVEKDGRSSDNTVGIWKSFNGQNWSRILTVSSDPFTDRYAVVRFPREYSGKNLIFSLQNTDKYNNSIMIIKE